MFFPNRRRGSYDNRYMSYDPFRYQMPSRNRPNNLSNIVEKSASGFSKTLGNVQQVLNLVQTAAPVIEEYGPMIKNLPSLYRMLKIMNEAEEAPVEQDRENKEKTNEENKVIYKSSKPRLFI